MLASVESDFIRVRSVSIYL